jgi:hypothetical protein
MHRTLMTLDMFMLDGDVTSKVMAVAALPQRADGAARLRERHRTTGNIRIVRA